MNRILLVLWTSCCVFGARLSAQEIDLTFNSNGLLPYLGPNSNGEGNLGNGYASVVQPDGKIVTTRDVEINNTEDLFMHLYRYLPDGMPDPTFGINGAAKTFCGQNSVGYDVELQSDGKIVIIGESKYCINGICGAPQFVMMRFKTDGVLDSTFGENGHLLTSHVFGTTGTFSIPKSLHILPDGKFLVGGRGPSGKACIVRLNSNGFPDNTYGVNGVFTLPDQYRAGFIDMAISANGETYGLFQTDTWDNTIMGYDPANFTDNGVFKLTPSGTLDLTFGTNGVFIFNTDVTDKPQSIILTSTNKLFVAGHNMPEHGVYTMLPFQAFGQANQGFVASLSTNGTWDNSIPNGFVSFAFPEDSATFFTKILERNPGEFLVCGNMTGHVNYTFQHKGLVVSMNAQGQLNSSFNGNGYMIFDHGTPGPTGGEEKLANLVDIDVVSADKVLFTGYRNPLVGGVKRSIYMFRLVLAPGSYLAAEDFSNKVESITVYPNPVADNRFTMILEEAATIQLLSLDGRVLYENEIPAGTSQIEPLINYKGMSILKLQTQTGKTGIEKLLFQ